MGSKFKCVFHCGNCGKIVLKNKSQTEKIKRGVAFCSLKCLGAYNGRTRRNKVEKICKICGKHYEVIPALAEKSVTCSVECQHKWQSLYLVGEKANNFKGGNRTKVCEYCGKEYKCKSLYQTKHRRFCSKDCKNKYWIENTLTSEDFKQRRFEGNLKFRQELLNGKETLPEKMVREWLTEHGIEFKQEQGFFHKYFADFYLPKHKMIIEVMGDYWHANPEIYGEGKLPLNADQTSRIEKDEQKKRDFVESGFRYIELWESDIYEDVDAILTELFPATTIRRKP